MNSTLSFEHFPTWYLVFCVLAGFLYALFLYFRDNSFKEASKKQKLWLWPISLFRFLAVSTISFLLLSPLIKTRFIEVVKPYILIAQDNSESVKNTFTGNDSTSLSNSLAQIQTELGEDYRVVPYHFGSNVEEGFDFSYKEKVTNLSQCLEELSSMYSNQNVGALVLATDGIYNQGSNPLYANARLDIPIYSIAVGDTTSKRDLLVERVLHNRIAYLDDKFTIRVDVGARNAKGSSTVLSVYQNSNKLFSKTINVNNKEFLYSEEVVLDAKTAGLNQYSIRLSSIDEEVSTSNNIQEIYVDVLDSRRKILILASSPHPDIAAIRQSIELNKNYESTIAYAGLFKGSVKDYNLAILHGLPNKLNKAEAVINQLKDSKIPIWYILSTQTSTASFNKIQNVIKINGASDQINDAKAEGSGSFNLFTIDEQFFSTIRDFPPLSTPFGEYKAAPTAQTLLKQRIGSVSTAYPLFAFDQSKDTKSAVLCGEGLWRWKMYDYRKDQNHETFDNFVSKTVQYLSVKNDKRKFRVNMAKNLFNENEPIVFDAELYNDSYELINESEVQLTIYDSEDKAYPYNMSRSGGGYQLNAGFFPVGSYTYRSETSFNGNVYKASGKFSVAPIQLESLQTTANHQLLHSLSKRFTGSVVSMDQTSELIQQIKSNEEIAAVQFSTFKTQSLINLKWLFFLILGFLALEWFIRKFLGGY